MSKSLGECGRVTYVRWSSEGTGGTTGPGPWIHGVIEATFKWGPRVSLTLLLPELVKTR